jgi:hypothetical protein
MPTWPNTLPKALIEGYAETPANNVLRTQMDVGPAKTRRRTFANVRNLTINLLLSSAQWTALDNFYDVETLSGSLPFDMPHPRTNVTGNFRFVSPPQLSALSSNYFKIAVSLEQLP